MLRRTARALQWMGGTHTTAVLGGKLQQHESQYIQMEKAVTSGILDRDSLTGVGVEHWTWKKHNRTLRPDIYSEIQKLPLRFSLHNFETVNAEMSKSAVGYAAPLGPADPVDVIPFHIHRKSDGTFNCSTPSTSVRVQNPKRFLVIGGVEGDVFRFEEEMIKLLPTFRTFIHDDRVLVWDVTGDVIEILEHWFIGLGF